jgi:hypothetical protein
MGVGRLCCLAMVALLACSGDDGGDDGDDGLMTDGPTEDGGAQRCVDEDGDGFGRGCSGALDCDDDDPEVTDECYRCGEPDEGCPCEPGTEQVHCVPDPKRVSMNGVTGTLVCSEGARYCRDGAWTECEFLALYTRFIRD